MPRLGAYFRELARLDYENSVQSMDDQQYVRSKSGGGRGRGRGQRQHESRAQPLHGNDRLHFFMVVYIL